MIEVCAVGLGGFVGAIARYGLSGLVHTRYAGSFPLGTLVVNVLGCLVIGALLSLVETRPLLHPRARLFLVMGLLGSFTTFSTLGFETLQLLRDREVAGALLNVGANVVLGVGAVAVGWMGVRWVGV